MFSISPSLNLTVGKSWDWEWRFYVLGPASSHGWRQARCDGVLYLNVWFWSMIKVPFDPTFTGFRHSFVTTGCLKKNGILWKNGHNFLQNHPKCKIWGCFGKFRIFATLWALRFSKLKKKWLRKWSLKLPTPSKKIGKILCSQFTLIDPLSHSLGHYGLWTWHIRPRIQNYLYFSFYQCVEQILLSLQVMKMQRIIKGVHNVSSGFCRFLEGG